MKILLRSLLILVSVLVGLETGFAWKAHARAKNLKSEASLTDATDAGQTNKTKSKKNSYRDDSPLASQLQRDLAHASGVEKWLHWMAALEKAQPADFPRLARLARGNKAVWRFLVKRWVQVAPRNLFDTMVASSKNGGDLPFYDLGRELFTQWAKTDPDSAIAALNEPGAETMQPFRMEVATQVMNTDPEKGLQLMQDWHIENYGPYMDGVKAWAAANPEHAAEFTMAHPAGFVSELTIDTIGEQWAKTDPAGALAFAESQSGALASRLANSALKQWASQDLQAAGDWLAQSDDHTLNALSPAFVETWAKQDPQAALSWCENNLQGIQLQQAVTGVMNGAAAKDVNTAASMVTAMQPGDMRSEAAGAVAQKWFPGFGSTDPVPAGLLTWMSGLDTASIKQALNQVTWGWVSLDPPGMAKFLTQVGNDAVPDYTDPVLVRQWARTDPVAALNWAATLPDSRGMEAGAEGFTEWRQAQPDAANTWLNNLPANDPRRAAFAKR